MTDGENYQLAHGLEEHFFPVVLLCQFFWLWWEIVFWFWGETVFGITYVLRVQYSCVGLSVFWLWQEIVLKMRTPAITL